MSYELSQKELTSLRRRLTTAVKSKDKAKIISTCDAAMRVFEAKGYPDDWSRWERAKQDAQMARIFGVFN